MLGHRPLLRPESHWSKLATLTVSGSITLRQVHGCRTMTASVKIYNLSGQRVDNTYKGIVIKNGKKVVVK